MEAVAASAGPWRSTRHNATYTAERMYGAAVAFGSRAERSRFLFGQTPAVLALEKTPVALAVRYRSFGGPASLGEPARPRDVRLFNPSIVRAPAGLCERCAYVAAVRADTLHQCDEASPLFSWQRRTATGAFFKGAAILALDAEMRTLGWTWLLTQPSKQVILDHATDRDREPRWHALVGAADGFDPPWAQPVFDARLLNLDGQHLFVTYVCKACAFSVSQLHLTARRRANGGLHGMRAWASLRVGVRLPYVQGRNQALFAVPTAAGAGPPRHAVQVQPWLGLVGTLGAPCFRPTTQLCYPAGPAGYASYRPAQRQLERQSCATSPANTSLTVDRIDNFRPGARGGAAYGELQIGRAHV